MSPIRVAGGGCSGCTCKHPQGGEKKFRRNSQGKFFNFPPQHTKSTPRWSKSQFSGHFLLCREDLELELVVFDRLLEATTKKSRQLFEEKSAPSFESDK